MSIGLKNVLFGNGVEKRSQMAAGDSLNSPDVVVRLLRRWLCPKVIDVCRTVVQQVCWSAIVERKTGVNEKPNQNLNSIEHATLHSAVCVFWRASIENPNWHILQTSCKHILTHMYSMGFFPFKSSKRLPNEPYQMSQWSDNTIVTNHCLPISYGAPRIVVDSHLMSPKLNEMEHSRGCTVVNPAKKIANRQPGFIVCSVLPPITIKNNASIV